MKSRRIPLPMTLVAILSSLGTSGLAEEKTYAQLQNEDVFMVAHNRMTGCAIGVDTARPECLKLAIELQDKLHSLSGARLPIEYIPTGIKEASRDVRFQMIYFTEEVRSTGDEPAYTISWEFHQPGYSINCSKRIRIAYSTIQDARDAIDFLLKKEWGTGLKVDETEKEDDGRFMLYIPIATPEKDQDVVIKRIVRKEKPQAP